MVERSPGSRFDFNLVAEKYDRWYSNATGAMYDRLEKKAVADLLPGDCHRKKLLEVGCRTGHWSRFFSELGLWVTGIDIAPSIIEIAAAKRIYNALFVLGDAHRLPFEKSSFDMAAIITALEFVREPELVIREMIRCVRKPGGILLVAVFNSLAGINRRRKAAGNKLYEEAQFYSPSQLSDMLSPYGTEQVVSVGFVPRPKWLLPLAPVLEKIARFANLPFGAFLVGRVKL